MDDQWHQHPKRLRAGGEACDVFWASVSWCNANLTDGKLPRAAAVMLSGGEKQLARVARRLLEAGGPGRAGLWEADGEDFVVHDFLDYNLSAAQVLAARQKTADRVARHRGRQRGGNGGGNREGNGGGNGVTNDPVTPAPPGTGVGSSPAPEGSGVGDPRAREDGFALVRAVYPVQEAMLDAEHAWHEIGGTPELAATIVADVRRRQQHDDRWLRGFIPHLVTYLRGRRWEDRPVARRRRGPVRAVDLRRQWDAAVRAADAADGGTR